MHYPLKLYRVLLMLNVGDSRNFDVKLDNGTSGNLVFLLSEVVRQLPVLAHPVKCYYQYYSLSRGYP